jgi:hypothetical protein
LQAFWDAISNASEGLEDIKSIQDKLNSTSILVLIDTANNDFKMINKKYEVPEIPYYFVLQNKKIIAKGKADSIFLDILSENFKHQNVRESVDSSEIIQSNQVNLSVQPEVVIDTSSESVVKEETIEVKSEPKGTRSSKDFDKKLKDNKVNLYSPFIPYLNGFEKGSSNAAHQNPMWEYPRKQSIASINRQYQRSVVPRSNQTESSSSTVILLNSENASGAVKINQQSSSGSRKSALPNTNMKLNNQINVSP